MLYCSVTASTTLSVSLLRIVVLGEGYSTWLARAVRLGLCCSVFSGSPVGLDVPSYIVVVRL